MPESLSFVGRIAGLGTTSGVRLVVGIWHESPLGAFGDVMIQQPDGHRILLAPDDDAAAFVEATYSFDEVVIGSVRVSTHGAQHSITAPGLDLSFDVGARSPIGWLLSLLPRRLAIWPVWLRAVNPIAQILLNGVRTAGSAKEGRREFYGAFDVQTIAAAAGSWRGQRLGSLAAVDPPVTFGFGSTPRTPALTSLVTTIR